VYYVGVLFAGMMFWFTYYLPLLVKTLRNWRSAFDQHREVLLVIYSFIPLVFFSFSGSKLPSYIVPALPFFAILLAYWIFEKYKNQAFRVIQIINVSIGLIIPVLLIVKPFKNVPAGIDHYNFLFWGLGFLPIGFSAVYWYRLKRNKIRFEWLYGIYNVVFFMILVTVLPSVQSDLNSFEDMAKVINQKFTTGERIAAYKIRLPSLYFYTGQRVIHIMHDREIQFEDEDSKNELEQYLSDDPDKLAELISGEIGTYVAVRKKDWRNYLTEHLKLGATVDTLYQNQKFLLLKNHRSGT
ncbi:MAG: hypothetical protein ACE5D7_05220, partial [Fidelibacterota bacterium]